MRPCAQPHPEAPTPGFYRAERLFDDARRLRATMGDAAFFARSAAAGTTPAAGAAWRRLGRREF